MEHWDTRDIQDLSGRHAVVTGATSGLGWETAAALAAHGARLTLAVRDTTRGDQAADRIRAATPQARLEVARLDLADLASVREFAADWSAGHPDGLDLLINNAGVMAIPRRESADGFELQFATNHLGHFALTGLLLGDVLAAGRERGDARIVTVSSGAHRMGRMRFDDLLGERRYRPWAAYGQSKLANLLFTFELQRRLDAGHAPAVAVAAHPGYADTNLQAVGPAMSGSAIRQRAMAAANRLLAQSAAMGALPTLFAACAPGVPGGSYVGPGGAFEQRGYPRFVGTSSSARDEQAAAHLWEISERLTGVSYPLPARG